jgi:hypothetical protein
MKTRLALTILFFMILHSVSSAQYEWSKLAYYHSTGPAEKEIQCSYQIELTETGSGKLEYTKYGRTNIYEFESSSRGLREIDRLISKSKVLDADTSDLRGSKEYSGKPVYLLTIFLDKPTGSKKRKHPVVIVQSEVIDRYREGAFAIYEKMEGVVPKDVWDKAFAEAEKNSGN